MNDSSVSIVNGGASTTASGTHTPEPWPFWLRHHSYDRNVPEGFAYIPEADYDRARVCVNACAGILTSELEAEGADALDLADGIKALAKQRDELAAALQAAVTVIKGWHNADEIWDIYHDNAPEMKPIREALTKVQVDGTAPETSTRSADE